MGSHEVLWQKMKIWQTSESRIPLFLGTLYICMEHSTGVPRAPQTLHMVQRSYTEGIGNNPIQVTL